MPQPTGLIQVHSLHGCLWMALAPSGRLTPSLSLKCLYQDGKQRIHDCLAVKMPPLCLSATHRPTAYYFATSVSFPFGLFSPPFPHLSAQHLKRSGRNFKCGFSSCLKLSGRPVALVSSPSCYLAPAKEACVWSMETEMALSFLYTQHFVAFSVCNWVGIWPSPDELQVCISYSVAKMY